MKRRQQNQKFPSFQIFWPAAGGVEGAATKNDRKFLGFAPREQGASVIRHNPADFVRNTFELRPIHTAEIFKKCSDYKNPSCHFTKNGCTRAVVIDSASDLY